MAKYRQLYTEFWSDSFVLELTSQEKFFYLYLLTNTKTTQSGIYEISKRFIEMETGINRETVDELIEKFCEYNKILYCEETKEIMVLNWIKYNVPNNINAILGVQKELKKVKNKEFLKVLLEKCKADQLDVEKIFENIIVEKFIDDDFFLEINSDDDVEQKEIGQVSEFSINRPLDSPLQAPYMRLPSNRIRSKEQRVINKEQGLRNKEEEVKSKETVAIDYKNKSAVTSEGLKKIIKVFEENIHVITPFVYEKILDFTKQVSSKVIIMAIYEAVNYNAKTIKYIAKILNNWISNGIKTDEQVIIYQKQWANKKSSRTRQNVKSGGFCDYEQRTYDFDILEKQLLGLA